MNKKRFERAIFAMGCFWKPEHIFSRIIGVVGTKAGYIGGNEKQFLNPSYEQVCSNKTGYTEAVEITFNSSIISYTELLDIFWKNHDSTSLNKQGVDFGTQYRSEIFYTNEKQKNSAIKSRNNFQKKLNKIITTEIRKAPTFFPAEEYHQKYMEKHGRNVC
ncbi:peptide-methionine (S)-S-oxide reductase MsrA [Candidatus Pacearchaeota archaeon]|nr:peptide-methionine (S)-S-oxide reductase MsrA [Candidatus Pacearchaeota archaeon]